MVLTKNSTTRGKLISAGLALFSSKGFTATTTRELAKEAGVAEVTLFRHFSSKEKLFEEVISGHSIIPGLQALRPELEDKSCEEALTLIANYLYDSMIARKDWIVLMQMEVRHNPEKLLTLYHTFLDRLFVPISDYIRAQQLRGVMRDFDADLAARAFYGMIFSFFNTEEVLHRKEFRATPKNSAISTFVGLFSQGASA